MLLMVKIFGQHGGFLKLILNNALSINPSKNLVFHDGYNFEDSPEHFNRKAL